jgi:serine/threonine protein kinase
MHEDSSGTAPPERAARYTMHGRIGRGGMGEVMAARDHQVGRDVAIKRMRSTSRDVIARQRFLREARVQGRLEHPAIVPVHEVGHDEWNRPYFAMKLVSGRTLADLVREPGATSLQRLLRGFADVCLAVEFAHVRGIIHRDLKPDNVMFGEFGEVYVLDWGVAKEVGEPDAELATESLAEDPVATHAGTVVGTPGYIAPEQQRGLAEIDGRADVFSLGCLLFEILTGEPRELAANPGAPTRPSLRAPHRNIPPELDELCVATTAVERDARPSAREVGDRVFQYLDGDRDLALRQRLARDHFRRAETAFRGGTGDDDRASAMRSAAAAVALDPTLSGPGQLITRLMLEPPGQTPRAVARAIHEDDARTAIAHTKASLLAIACGLALAPFQWWMAPAGSHHMYAYTALLAVAGAICALLVYAQRPWPGLIVVINVLIVLIVALMYTPLFIAPGLAAALAMACALTPRFSHLGSAVAVAALMIGAVLGPYVLELVGVLPKQISVGAAGVVFRAPAIAANEAVSVLAASIYAIGLIVGAVAMADLMRRRTREAHHRLHLQAWQLRQLVPEEPGLSP